MNSHSAPRPGDSQRQLDDLRRGLHDLAKEQRRLQSQIATLVESVEALAASRTVHLPPPSSTLKAPHSPSLTHRIAKSLLRRMMTTVRRLWQLGAAQEDSLITEVVETPALDLPTVTLVLLDPSPQEAQAAHDVLARQSTAIELVLWNRIEGLCRVMDATQEPGPSNPAPDLASLRRQIRGDYVGTLTSSTDLRHLPSTTLELLGWALAAEKLTWLDLCAHQHGKPCGLRLVRRQLWHPEGDIENTVLSRSQEWLGKEIYLPRNAPGRPLAAPALHPFRPLGKGYYHHGTQVERQALKPLHHLPTTHDANNRNSSSKNSSSSKNVDNDEGTLIVLTVPLTEGVEHWLADLCRAEILGKSCTIACCLPSHELHVERMLALENLVHHVYPLADLLPAELVESALPLLLRRAQATQVIHLGERPLSEAARKSFPESVSLVEFTLGALGDLSCGIDLEVFAPEALETSERLRWRERLGIDEEQILVTQASDLVAEQRPEDFVALAHHLREDHRFVFLMVGRGPRAALVDDLIRYLAPPRLHRVESVPWPQLLKASDVVTSTAERQPLPYFLLTALACRLPIVAAKAPGLSELLIDGFCGDGPCGIVVPLGDSAAMAAELTALGTSAARQELGRRGRTLVEARFSLSTSLETLRLQLARRSQKS